MHQQEWEEADVERLFTEHFTPLQLEVVADHSALIPGVLECVAELRDRGIKIGTITGYFRAAAVIVFHRAAMPAPSHELLK